MLLIIAGIVGANDEEDEATTPTVEPVVVTLTEEPEESAQPTAQAEPTPEPTPRPVRISAEELWRERENNATRFDDTYKGKWVVVYGEVAEVDDGDVRLTVDSDSLGMDLSEFGIDTSDIDLGLPLMAYIAMQDLPREQQAAPNAGDQFEATCKVEDFRAMGYEVMYLGDCHSGRVVELLDAE